jgi:hypothetical protein
MSIDSLQELLDLISNIDLDESDRIVLQQARWAGNDMALDLVIHQMDQADQRWCITCEKVRNSEIRNHAAIDRMSVETEHPLLLPHTSSTVELYFRGQARDAGELISQLLDAHGEMVEAWFDFTHFFNVGPRESLRQLLDGGFGKLAEGPELLMEAYARTLRANGVEVSSPFAKAPVWWDGERWMQEGAGLAVLILGESYCVAPRVTAVRKERA